MPGGPTERTPRGLLFVASGGKSTFALCSSLLLLNALALCGRLRCGEIPEPCESKLRDAGMPGKGTKRLGNGEREDEELMSTCVLSGLHASITWASSLG